MRRESVVGAVSALAVFLCLVRPAIAQEEPTSRPATAQVNPVGTATSAPTTRPTAAPAERKLGAYHATISGLLDPGAVAIDDKGRIYVAESGRHRVSVFDKKGKPVRTIGRKGSGDGELFCPAGVAISTNGDVFVSDSGNHRIVVFDRKGQFRLSWGGYGSELGRLIHPMGLSVSDTRVSVADAGNDRIQVFDRRGDVLRHFGEWGANPGQFRRPVDVDISRGASFHVLDRDNNRVQAFDPLGKNPRAWGGWGPFPDMLGAPLGICLREYRLYVADTANHRVQVASLNGPAVFQWGVHAFMPREGNGKLHFPNAIAVAPDGTFAVVCEGFENRCQIFGLMPPGESPPTSPFVQNDPSGQSHFGPSAGLSGNLVALTEEEIDQVSIHNLLDGAAVRISMVGQHGVRPGQFVRPSGLDLDVKSSTLVVGDAGNRRLHIFSLKQDPPGQLRFIPQMAQLIKTLDFESLRRTTPELQKRPVIEPTVVRRDELGSLFVLDAIQGVVVVLSNDFKVLRVWPEASVGPPWIRPTDLALDPSGETVYICDGGRGTVRSYSLEGRPRDQWTAPELKSPGGVAVKSDGTLFVSDEFSGRIFKFDANGALLKSWGAEGLGAGQLYRPRGIMLTDAGHLLVVDYGNHRCQLFTVDGKFLNMFGAPYFVRAARSGGLDAKNVE